MGQRNPETTSNNTMQASEPGSAFATPFKSAQTPRAQSSQQAMFSPHFGAGDQLQTIEEKTQPTVPVTARALGAKNYLTSGSGRLSSLKKDSNLNHASVYERASGFAKVQCPYCGRKFAEKASQRHIEHCKEKFLLKQRQEMFAHKPKNPMKKQV